MEVSEQVRFLEEKVKAFEKMYGEEIERELELDKNGITVGNLTRYDWAPSLENHFYPMKISKTGRELGLILPFRRLIFHSLDTGLTGGRDKVLMDALIDLSDRREYGLEYHEFAWQHGPIIEGLCTNKLPEFVF